ncbi:MAG: NADH:ubiquinone reductase (Na(+)-transporting) subunit C [Bacteroidaceae bacterium]|nr:NADH:ubiquinone reductase (Na(+)-transporting) subunit C [Bacteroidaceae bacterium]
MVILVAFLLVFVSSTLKERQTANVINDTKAQILASLNIKDQADVASAYQNAVKADMLMQADGSLVPYEGEFCTGYSSEYDAGRLHVFQAEVDGQTKYVIPMNGLGLWGVIWGYIALDEDRQTVYGVYFSHASETPGLGGEIAAPLFQSRFPGKIVTSDGQVALQVLKFGKADKTSAYQIDGVTGATITSTGVNNMINKVLTSYLPFLNGACCAQQCCNEDGCEEEQNVESIED